MVVGIYQHWTGKTSKGRSSFNITKDLYSRKDSNLVFSRVARFYATTEQKLIHSFWNTLRIRRKINQLHQSSCYASSKYYTKQSFKVPCLHEIDIPKCINVYSIYRTKLCVIGFFVLSFLICFQMYETLLYFLFYFTCMRGDTEKIKKTFVGHPHFRSERRHFDKWW
jgi:hypothetical protein